MMEILESKNKAPKLVSIIVPVYNSAKSLKTCVKSILDQTYGRTEVILVDDGSKDMSSEIITRYKEKFPEKIVSLKQSNSGAARARNYGLEKANGDYVIFVDSDDYIDSSYVDTLINSMEKSLADCVVSGFRKVTEEGEILFSRRVSSHEWGKYSTILMCGRAFRRKALIDYSIRFLENNIGEDVYMNLIANLVLKVVAIDYIGYNWVNNLKSVSNTAHKKFNKEIKFIEFLDITYTTVSELKSLSERKKEFLEYFFIKTCIYYILTSGRGVEYETLKKESRKIMSWLVKKFPKYRENSLISVFTPKGEKFSTRLIISLYILSQKLNMENVVLIICSNLK